ncbi:sensor histidine kinase [Pontibacter fetidus]|uniref:GHKL domain-containing protein n=1 Tax=Pontibacter fetidus TaxID=2700082 RepID=A0A6B2HAN2_9BACT|nr:histidine kinase [Pontibacter fetidus]NDK56534.1 GHKL domain-containing protein [Pontibacter fetidus]
MAPARVIWLYMGWAAFWSGVFVLVLLPANYSPALTLKDALLYNLLLTIAGYAAGTGLRYYQPTLRQGVLLLAWSLGLAGICTLVYSLLIDKLLDDKLYLAFVGDSLPMRLVFGWLLLLLLLLINWFWFYTKEQRQHEERKAATEKLAREAELYTLRQQLQPHFLFNSLNSISALVVVRPDQARTMVQQLSDFLRGTLRKENQQQVTLTDELQQLELYLAIEKVRFGHRLQTIVEVLDDARNLKLPALLLQPIVENAIKFGLYGTTSDTTITIKAFRADANLVITIENPFDTDAAQTQEGTGFGLSSVQRRLYLLYARPDLVQTQQHENQFTTTVTIPQNYDQVPHN